MDEITCIYEATMTTFVTIAQRDEIPENGMRAFIYGERRILICHVLDQLYATDDICSHEYAELSEGWLEPEDYTIECPLHGSRFDVRTGQPLSLPAFEPIAVYPVRLEGDDVQVGLDDL
jgi:3-phenylpropionate/trans-cinnamate dioxygenase ferredoxin subunit